MDVDKYMDCAEQSYEDSGKAMRNPQDQAKILLLDSIAASLIAANELEYMKVMMIQKEHETQSAPAQTIKTVGGKEIEL